MKNSQIRKKNKHVIYKILYNVFMSYSVLICLVTFETEEVEIVGNHDSGDQLMTVSNKQIQQECSAVKKIN